MELVLGHEAQSPSVEVGTCGISTTMMCFAVPGWVASKPDIEFTVRSSTQWTALLVFIHNPSHPASRQDEERLWSPSGVFRAPFSHLLLFAGNGFPSRAIARLLRH